MADMSPVRRWVAAIERGDVETVRSLGSRYLSVLQEDHNGGSFLRIAAENNDLAMASLLVDEFGVDINSPESDTTPEGPICEAAGAGAAEVVRWMLGRGAILNHAVDGTLRCLALTHAVLGNHLEIVKMLVEAGAAINTTWERKTALSLAATCGHREIEAYLKSKGAIELGSLPLYKQLAPLVYDGDVEAVRALLQQDPSILRVASLRQNNGRSFLSTAAENNNLAMVSLLVDDFGVDVNSPESDTTPEGPIRDAAGAGAADVVRWMLGRGAIPNHRVDGTLRCLALTRAVIDNHLEIVKMLVEAGAAINATWAGQNALSIALSQGRQEIAEYLRSVGAVEPSPEGAQPTEEPSPLMEYMATHHGRLRPAVIQQILPVGPQFLIRIAESSDRIVLFTDGMAVRPLKLPKVGKGPLHVEVMIVLPADWKVGPDALQDARYSWPITLLRRIASDPGKSLDVADRAGLVFSAGDVNAPIAPDSTMSCVMARPEGRVSDKDGRTISLYRLLPIYPEERDACRKGGVAAVVKALDRLSIGDALDLHRQVVAPG